MPEGELEKWIRWTNIKLKMHGKLLTKENEMTLFLGTLCAITQVPKKVGIKSASYVCSYAFSSAPDLEKFGLKHWRFKELFSYWTFYQNYSSVLKPAQSS